MRRLVVVVAAAGVLMTGCGSSDPSVSVESAGDTGAPADAAECPANAPVRGVLKGDVTSGSGVFGQVHNDTDSPVWVWGQRTDGWSPSPCRLNPGMSASFGSSGLGFAGEFRMQLLVTSSQDPDAPGTMVGYVWGPKVRPYAVSSYQTAGAGTCDGDSVELRTQTLGSQGKSLLEGKSQGTIQVQRLRSSDQLAYEWLQTPDADWRWDHIDFSVLSIGRC